MCHCWEEQDTGSDGEWGGGFPETVDEFEENVGTDRVPDQDYARVRLRFLGA